MDGVPYTENIVYPPFIGAATGILNSKPSLSTPPPEQPYWRLQHEIGDGACGFRAIARHFLGDPELHHQIRQQLVQYMSENRHNNDLRIYEGINVELLYASGIQPFTYDSYDDYLAKMSSPYTYMGQPEITAVSAFYGKEVHLHFDQTTLPPPHFATTDDVHLRYSAVSRHYDTFQLIIPDPVEQPHAPISGGALSSAS